MTSTCTGPTLRVFLTPILTRLKVSAATAVHPDAVVIEAPAVAFLARRIAELLEEPDTSVCIGGTKVAVHIVRGAGNGLDSGARAVAALVVIVVVIIVVTVTIMVATAADDLEIGAATMVHPYTVPVAAPAVTFLATRIA